MRRGLVAWALLVGTVRLGTLVLGTTAVAAAAGAAPAPSPDGPRERPGVAPETPWACPAGHPIKGYLTDESGRIYHRPGTRFYEEASPERCYATEEEARRDGSRRAPDD
jgi:hypothetical protein